MSAHWQNWVTKREKIERVVVVGPIESSKEVMDQLHAEGFRCTVTGAYSDRHMHPKVDITRFKFIAEREIEEQNTP